MPQLFGPKNSRYAYTGSLCPHTDLALASIAKTLGEAIAHYEEHFQVNIRPCTEIQPGESELKYFNITEISGAQNWLVDIHILRDSGGGQLEICPKQNLSMELKATDMVEMGELIC